MDINVTKRNGRVVPFKMKSIRNAIEWAMGDIKCLNSMELEASFCLKMKEGIETSKIQKALIESALSLCSNQDPEWKDVAGRLAMWDYKKNIEIVRGIKCYENYFESVKYFTEKGLYSTELLSTYSKEELLEAGDWIVDDHDKLFDYAGTTQVTKKYLLANELPQEMFLSVALLIASIEPSRIRLNVARHIYKCISELKLSLASPILGNMRTERASGSSCFILSMDDSLVSIMDNVKGASFISQKGGGIGINFSKLRGNGATINKRKNAAKGVIPFMKIINDTMVAVNQGGKRSGAATVSLDIWHYDLLEFLKIQEETGDQRSRAYDIFPQLVVCDEYMRRVEADDDWYLFCPDEVKNVFPSIDLTEMYGEEFDIAYEMLLDNLDKLERYRKVSAKELFIDIMKTAIETGLPYLAFKDTINKANPNKYHGIIPSANLCCESFSVVVPDKYSHCCNLASLNLARIHDFEEIEEIAILGIRVLDNLIDITEAPTKEAKEHNRMFRTVGLGTLGLADHLAYKNKRYSSDDLPYISELYERIALASVQSSVDLAMSRGVFKAYHESTWNSGEMINCKPLSWFLKNSNSPYLRMRWESLSDAIARQGIRNSHLNCIAPNTTSSLLQGATASCLPAFNKYYYDKSQKGALVIAVPYLREKRWYYQENKTLDQNVVVDVVAEIQKWIDTGISMELIFNLNEYQYGGRTIEAKDIYDVWMNAWKKGCKTIYYTRCIQKSAVTAKSECEACAN